MRKNFQSWHLKKSLIHTIGNRFFFHEREIWFCSLGLNIGFEQDGRGDDFLRPVLILKKFNHETFWALPLTRADKQDHPYYFNFSFRDGVRSSAILSQLRLIDGKRLKYKAGTMTHVDFLALKTKIRQLLA